MEQRNLFLAIAVSVIILIGSQMALESLYPPPPPGEQIGQQTTADGQSTVPSPGPNAIPQAPNAPGTQGAGPAGLLPTRAAALKDSARLQIDTPRLSGSVALLGGRIDDLVMRDYKVSLDEDAANVVLFSPSGTQFGYYAQFGWVAGDTDVKVPGDDALWSSSDTLLTVDKPVVLTWDNGDGLLFKRTIAVDGNYLFTVTDAVESLGEASASLYPYGLIARDGTPITSGFFILHEGPIGVMNGTLEEEDYDDLVDAPNGSIEYESAGGWIGITDKYWLAALVPDQKSQIKARLWHRLAGQNRDKYQADFLIDRALTVAPNIPVESTTRLFAGAKEVKVLDSYQEAFQLPLFNRAVDFGYLWFMTQPLFYALNWLFGIVGNFGVAILIMTLAIKLVFFPLANKSYKAMSRMKLLQPEMMKLRERYGDDKQKMQQEMMAMYKREKVNPAAGCIPILIQIPVFFALYKVLFVSIEMRQAPFFGWIQDLSAPDPSNIFELFGLIPWGAPDLLHFGAWPLIMGLTMFLQQRLNPQPADPVQAKLFLFMPLVFTIFLASFPAGLVIYWAWNNTLSIAQQWIIMTRAKREDAEKNKNKVSGPPKPKAAADAKGKGKGKDADDKDAEDNDDTAADADEAASADDTPADVEGSDGDAPDDDSDDGQSKRATNKRSGPRKGGGPRKSGGRRTRSKR